MGIAILQIAPVSRQHIMVLLPDLGLCYDSRCTTKPLRLCCQNKALQLCIIDLIVTSVEKLSNISKKYFSTLIKNLRF